jgi:flagellar motor protein MotB
MKENEFLDGVSNIETDVVERFVTMDNKLQSRSKRSRNIWIRALALAACVALVIGVIATVVIFNRSKPVNYVIYADSVYAEELENAFSNGEEGSRLEIKNSSEKNFVLDSRDKKVKDDTVEKTYTLKIDGKEYVIDYNNTYESAAAASEKMKEFAKYNVYVSLTPQMYLEINASTNEVKFFSIDATGLKAGEGTFNADDAEAKAADIIGEVYGTNTLDAYKYYDTRMTDTESKKSYTAVYKRYVHDIQTEDYISVTFNKDGEVIVLSAKNKGSLATAEKDLRKKEIENAIAKLNDAFSDEWNIHEPSLIRDVNGDYYIQCFIYRGANGDSEGTYAYINVQ